MHVVMLLLYIGKEHYYFALFIEDHVARHSCENTVCLSHLMTQVSPAPPLTLQYTPYCKRLLINLHANYFIYRTRDTKFHTATSVYIFTKSHRALKH